MSSSATVSGEAWMVAMATVDTAAWTAEYLAGALLGQ